MSRKRQPIDRGRVLDAQHIQNQLKLSRSELRHAREAQKVALDEVAAACARVTDENTTLRTELAAVTKQRDDLRVVQTAWLASPEAAKRLEGYRELGAKCAALEGRVLTMQLALQAIAGLHPIRGTLASAIITARAVLDGQA